jgi:small nuclear ribonucleoprotein (snRNP)-like protein
VNKVVARLKNGNVIKGITANFSPGKDIFHVSVKNAPAGAKPVEIHTKDMKALFFVKDFEGNPKHIKRNEFDPEKPAIGRRIRVVFRDGEVLVGTTSGYQPGRPGFFVIPADTNSNNERCYVVAASTQEISFL